MYFLIFLRYGVILILQNLHVGQVKQKMRTNQQRRIFRDDTLMLLVPAA